MADTPSITLVKTFSYRGQPEEFSNTYHFSGTTPGSDADWKSLAEAIWGSEKTCYQSNNVKLVRFYGYAAGNEHAVSGHDYQALGETLIPSTGSFGTSGAGYAAPGDAAMTLKALRAGRSSKGKPVYCIKFMHGVWHDSSNSDQVVAAQKSAVAAHGAKLLDGTLPGNFKWCAPQAATLSNPMCGPFVTTRTLKRRGKRPH